MKKFLKNNKGIAGTDTMIAILIIALFTGIIATILYNIYISNTSLKRMSRANLYATQVLEYVDKIFYYDLDTTTNLLNKYTYLVEENNAGNSEDETLKRMWKLQGSPQDGYTVSIILDKYTPSNSTLDLVSKITVNVNYKVGKRNQEITISSLKSRENLITPNKPDVSLLELQENENFYAVKEVNGNYIVCSQNDHNWYSYNNEVIENSNFATVIITEEELNIGNVVGEITYTVYEWIPRFAQNLNDDMLFLYGDTDNYITTYLDNENNSYKRLSEIPVGYTTSFLDGQTGIWEELDI